MNLRTILILLLFKCSCFLSQTNNYYNPHFTINTSSNFYFRQLGGYFTDLKVPENNNKESYQGPYIAFKDRHRKDGLFISAGADVIYNFKRDGALGYSFGIAYNYIKDFYNYSYQNREVAGSKITDTYANANGNLTNHLVRFVLSINWTTKRNFTFYVRPLNYEIRFIDNNSTANYNEYDVVLKKIPSYYSASGKPYHEDSLKTLVNVYESQISFVRSVSFCFPTTIGVEQKFMLKNLRLNVGLSFGGSILELYYVPRAYIGICLGKFNKE